MGRTKITTAPTERVEVGQRLSNRRPESGLHPGPQRVIHAS